MRSGFFTLILALAAFLAAGLVAVGLITGNLNYVFGVPPTPVGKNIYQDLQPSRIRRITLTSDGTTAELHLENGIWMALRPFNDRADPRFAKAIIDFTRGAKVEDAIPMAKIDGDLIGLRAGTIMVRLEDASARPAAKYIIGRRTAWSAEDPESGELIPTVFIRPMDRRRKDHVYACSGDIHPLVRDGFRFLRDHRPFYFHPDGLDRVRVRNSDGEFTLARDSPASPWRIIKPLQLRTDVKAVSKLLGGLYELTATRVTEREDLVLPDPAEGTELGEIAISSFGSDTETVLTLYPTADNTTSLATVTGRDGVFELPIKPKADADLVTLALLPLSVNALRDQTLTQLAVGNLASITISNPEEEPIVLQRNPGAAWMIKRDGRMRPLNEKQLFSMLKAITETKVADFATDAATDFSPYGLDAPALRLRFTSTGGDALVLAFGRGPDGMLYARRDGSNSVVRVEDSILSDIGIRAHHWRSPALWSLTRGDVIAIVRKTSNQPDLILSYNDSLEKWSAQRDGKDVSVDLNPNRADYLLNQIASLQVSGWLSAGSSEAALALAKPPLVIELQVRRINDFGEQIAIDRHTLSIAPVSDSPQNQFYYAHLSSEPNLFMLDQPTVLDLLTDVLTEE
jgi:hypothetical protein